MNATAVTQSWEGVDTHNLLRLLIGYEFGPEPEKHIDAIRAWRANIVEFFDECFLRLDGSETALEIGSGCGFTSRALAARVRELHCVDVSESFLQFARAECAGVANVRFHRASYTQLGCIPSASIDAVLASAVLIHADLFALNLFFAELARVLRPGGRVAFDFLDANRLSPEDALFTRHTAEYREDPARFTELCKWNPGPAVGRLAAHHGFTAIRSAQRGASNSVLFAVRAGGARWRMRLLTPLRKWRFGATRPRDHLRPPG